MAFRFSWLLVGVASLFLTMAYIAKPHYSAIGFCPANAAGQPSVLVLDESSGALACSPVPSWLGNDGVLEPRAPSGDKKVGA